MDVPSPARPDVLLLTCEHAGNKVPARYRRLFRGHSDVLKTHRGYDIGALKLARYLAAELHAPLLYTDITRLLVEVNRSRGHEQLFSEFTRDLDPAEQSDILDAYYDPHRERVELMLDTFIEQGRRVIHIGVHSFTPVLHGKARNADIGLLFDPARAHEQRLCTRWQRAMRKAAPELRVRRNYPYHGASDGLTTHLRNQFPPDRYLGIELEVNQALLQNRSQSMAIRRTLAQTLETSLAI
jgi:predicted N-formylglutamate amidohydrolase